MDDARGVTAGVFRRYRHESALGRSIVTVTALWKDKGLASRHLVTVIDRELCLIISQANDHDQAVYL